MNGSDAQTLFVLCGTGQSKSIPHYLYESPKNLHSVTQDLPVYESILRKDMPEQQVDKLCIAEIMFGAEYKEPSAEWVLEEVPESSKEVIRKIAKNMSPLQNDH